MLCVSPLITFIIKAMIEAIEEAIIIIKDDNKAIFKINITRVLLKVIIFKICCLV